MCSACAVRGRYADAGSALVSEHASLQGLASLRARSAREEPADCAAQTSPPHWPRADRLCAVSAITGSTRPYETLKDLGQPRHHWRLFAPLRDDVFSFFSSRSFLAPPFHAPVLLTGKTGAESFKACRARQSSNNISQAVSRIPRLKKAIIARRGFRIYRHRFGVAVQYCSLLRFHRSGCWARLFRAYGGECPADVSYPIAQGNRRASVPQGAGAGRDLFRIHRPDGASRPGQSGHHGASHFQGLIWISSNFLGCNSR
jgi:hypothetical protein